MVPGSMPGSITFKKNALNLINDTSSQPLNLQALKTNNNIIPKKGPIKLTKANFKPVEG